MSAAHCSRHTARLRCFWLGWCCAAATPLRMSTARTQRIILMFCFIVPPFGPPNPVSHLLSASCPARLPAPALPERADAPRLLLHAHAFHRPCSAPSVPRSEKETKDVAGQSVDGTRGQGGAPAAWHRRVPCLGGKRCHRVRSKTVRHPAAARCQQ